MVGFLSMRLPRLFATALLLRRLVRELQLLRETQQQQTALLARLVDAYFPAPASTDFAAETATKESSGVSFLDDLEAGLVQDYIERTTRDTGRPPTEDETLTWLADAKTVDLHQRLKARQQELVERPRRSEP